MGLPVDRDITSEESSHFKAELEPKPVNFGSCDEEVNLKERDMPKSDGAFSCLNDKCSKSGVKSTNDITLSFVDLPIGRLFQLSLLVKVVKAFKVRIVPTGFLLLWRLRRV